MRSRVPLRHVVSAAIDALQRQITDGTSAPSAPPLAMDFGNFAVSMARDEHGNARGGVRLAHVEAPTARTKTGRSAAHRVPGFPSTTLCLRLQRGGGGVRGWGVMAWERGRGEGARGRGGR